MNSHPTLHRARGFSLVELMVSVVVGLLALMFATRLVVGSEQNKQASLGGSDAMQNGMLAMFSITGDANQAGFGLNDAMIAGCNTIVADTDGFALATATRAGVTVTPLAAVVIQSNGAEPDVISLYSGSSMTGTGTVRIIDNYTAGTAISIDRVPYGFKRNDVIVAAPETPGTNCAMAQLSVEPAPVAAGAAQILTIGTGSAYRFNSGNLGATYVAGKARLFNLGQASSLSFHTWSVSEGFLRLRATDLAGASNAPATVIDNIVSIKAQYGFDTRPGAAFDPAAGTPIGAWSATMIDADGDGVAGSAGDYQHVVAMRLAVVARSKSPEKPNGAGACSATPVAPSVFASAQPSGVAAVPVTINASVAGDAVDWKCYRYRVFESIIPLRNSGWRPEA